MTAVLTNRMMNGKGRVLLISGGVAYPIEEHSEVSFVPNVKSTSWENSNSNDMKSIMTGRDWKCRIAFKGVSMDLLYLFLGGTKTAAVNSSVTVIGESSAVSAGTVTASNTPIVSPLTLVVYTVSGGVKTFFEKVTESPTGAQYTVSGTTITVNTSHNGTTLYRDYEYAGSSDATEIAFDPTSVLAPSVAIWATMKYVDMNNSAKYMNFYAKDARCISLSEFPGTNDGNLKDITAEFDINIDAADDFVITGEVS